MTLNFSDPLASTFWGLKLQTAPPNPVSGGCGTQALCTPGKFPAPKYLSYTHFALSTPIGKPLTTAVADSTHLRTLLSSSLNVLWELTGYTPVTPAAKAWGCQAWSQPGLQRKLHEQSSKIKQATGPCQITGGGFSERKKGMKAEQLLINIFLGF